MTNVFLSNRSTLALIAILLLTAQRAPAADAAPVWQLSPYRVQVLLAVAGAPDLGARVEKELLSAVAAQCDAVVGGMWDVTIAAAPTSLAEAMLSDLAGLTVAALPKPAPEVDKIVLLAVSRPRASYEVAARDYDVRTGLWSQAIALPATQRVKLPCTALRAMVRAFAPLTVIENVQAGQAVLWLRAGALEPRAKDLPTIKPGDRFQAVLRTSDRGGTVASVLPVAGILLSAEKTEGSEIHARIESTAGAVPPARNRKLVEPLALAIVPASEVAPRQPTATLGTDEPAADKAAALRLEAEGMAIALSDDLTDLVARRESLLALARLRLEAGQFDAVGTLLGQLGVLPGRDQFDQNVTQQKKRLLARTSDTWVQEQVEAAFAPLHAAVEKHLDPVALTKLAQDLKAAQGKNEKKK